MNDKLKTEIVDLMAGVLEIPADELTDETAIGDITAWDSLHHLLIIAAIEKKYGFRFQPETLVEIEDVADLVRETAGCLDA